MTALRQPMRFDEFLAWEERQDLRYEFDGELPRAMTGGSARHDQITFALRAALVSALRGKRCQPYGPNLKIRTRGDAVRYPDALVTCTAFDPSGTIAPEPVIVFEVVSPSSSRIDRLVKLHEYKAVTSIQRYVLLEQDTILATVLARQGPDWVTHALTAGDAMPLPEVGATLALDDCYAGVSFEGAPVPE